MMNEVYEYNPVTGEWEICPGVEYMLAGMPPADMPPVVEHCGMSVEILSITDNGVVIYPKEAT